MGFFKNFGGNFVDDIKKTTNQLTGNIPKAILCVPDISKDEELTVDNTIDNSDNLRRDLIENGSGQGVMASFKNLANRGTTGTIEKATSHWRCSTIRPVFIWRQLPARR